MISGGTFKSRSRTETSSSRPPIRMAGQIIIVGATAILSYLAGATLEFDLPATASDSATIQVIPPEGDSVSVNFALTRLR